MIAGLAHESRNALQRIQACLAILRRDCEGSSRAIHWLDRMQHAQDDLQRLYADIREYASPISLDRSCCRVDELWREAWTSLSPVHQDREASLVENTQNMDLVCDVDRFRMTQVFRNLFENAVAASPGPVSITVACEEATMDGRPALRLRLQDNGPGFTAEQKRRAFDPFYTTKTHGSGLGLSICRRIVEAHGGSIAVGEGAGGRLDLLLPRGRS
jgi:two-component system, LuxR family, sensor kinase FixL